MKAGSLRHKIRFQQRTDSPDGSGGVTTTWATYQTARASIEPLTGREYFDAHAINESLTVRIRTYFVTGLDTDMRILDVATGDLFDIQSILNLNRRNREVEIIANQINDEST